MDWYIVGSIFTLGLFFCLWVFYRIGHIKGYKRGYHKGYYVGGNTILDEWKRVLLENKDN